MKKHTKMWLSVISLLALLCACNSSTVSTMKTSQGPSSPSGYFLEAVAIPDVQKSGLTSSISIRVLNSDGTGADSVVVNLNGSTAAKTATTNANGNATGILTVAEGTNNVIVTIEDIGTSLSVLGQP